MKKALYLQILILVALLIATAVVCVQLNNDPALAVMGPGEVPEETENVPETTTEPPFVITWMELPENRELAASVYFVYDCDTEQFLTLSGDASDVVYPASITKLFTAYIAMQYVEPTDEVTAGDELDFVGWGSSVAEIEKGNILTVDMLVRAMLLPSGNDAAYVLAAHAGRAILRDDSASAQRAVDAFMTEMNRQAKNLGMTGSHFANPDGIHADDHYMTIGDLAILGKLSMSNPTVLNNATVSSQNVTFVSGEKKLWENTNELVNPNSQYYCPIAVGLKTGQTPTAGSCLLSGFTAEGKNLVIGVFGCPEKDDRFPDTLQLLNETLEELGLLDEGN